MAIPTAISKRKTFKAIGPSQHCMHISLHIEDMATWFAGLRAFQGFLLIPLGLENSCATTPSSLGFFYNTSRALTAFSRTPINFYDTAKVSKNVFSLFVFCNKGPLP